MNKAKLLLCRLLNYKANKIVTTKFWLHFEGEAHIGSTVSKLTECIIFPLEIAFNIDVHDGLC